MEFPCQIVEIEKFSYFHISWPAKKILFLFWYLLVNFSPLIIIVENIFLCMVSYGTVQRGAVHSYRTKLSHAKYKVVQTAAQFRSKLQSYWNAFNIVVAKQSSAEVHFF